MKHYIGLDVSVKTTAICIIDEKGTKVFQTSVPTTPEDIYNAIQRAGNIEIDKVGLEAGSMCHYLTEGLEKFDLPVICMESRKAARFLELKYNKTDENDAEGLAECLRLGFFTEVRTKNTDELGMSTLLRSRNTLVESRKNIQSTIRSILRGHGIILKPHSGVAFYNEAEKHMASLIPIVQFTLQNLLKVYLSLLEATKEFDREVKKQCGPREELLMTIPGVGPITALTFTTEVGDPTRFRNIRSVGAYMGMTPRQYSSGETTKMGKISKNGPIMLRSLLVEAGMVVLTRTQSWSKLKAWGMKIQRKHGTKKAAVAVGRKLSIIMCRMLITGDTFRYTDEVIEEETKEKIA